jgi:hypothetical protein
VLSAEKCEEKLGSPGKLNIFGRQKSQEIETRCAVKMNLLSQFFTDKIALTAS